MSMPMIFSLRSSLNTSVVPSPLPRSGVSRSIPLRS
jgi:hypothetical protein